MLTPSTLIRYRYCRAVVLKKAEGLTGYSVCQTWITGLASTGNTPSRMRSPISTSEECMTRRGWTCAAPSCPPTSWYSQPMDCGACSPYQQDGLNDVCGCCSGEPS